MPQPVSIPLETTPLLARSEELGYSTTKVKPKFRIIIPLRSGRTPTEITPDGSLIVTVNETSDDSDISGNYTPCVGTAHCEYCLEQGLDHNLEVYHQRKRRTWAKAAHEAEAGFGVYLSFYVCVLGIIVFLLLIFVYISCDLNIDPDQGYSEPSHPLIFPKSLGF